MTLCPAAAQCEARNDGCWFRVGGNGCAVSLRRRDARAREVAVSPNRSVPSAQAESEDRAIVSAIVALGQTLELKIVAEGVETIAQQEFLTEMGCDSLQGFLFGQPMPPAQFLAALAHHEAQHRPKGLEGLTPSSATD